MTIIPTMVEDMFGPQVTNGKVAFMALLIVTAMVLFVIDAASYRRMP